MADQNTSKSKRKKRASLGKRQLSTKVTSSNLWIPDRQLFEETARKRHITDAELMRDIIHKWAVTTRLAPDTEEGAQEIALINLQKETKKLIEEAKQELSSMLKQLLEAVSTHSDLLSLNGTQLSHVTSVTDAHYNVSAQSFAALWSLVEMFQRFYVEKTLPQDPDPHPIAVAIRDDIRGEGMRMMKLFTAPFQSTTPVKMILVYPRESEPGR
ncbi:MAG: hypothetical protein QOH96_71 [Blastocatellia bacterium]|jgi:hypothetical protein|nr:hypothetical protein [Blastocatellia bacterium]